MAQVTVYSKHNCSQCNFTKRFLDENNIAYEERNVDDNAQALEEVKNLGFQSLPVVKAEGLEPFNGFNPGKLNQLK